MQGNCKTAYTNIVLRPHWMQYCLCKLPDIAVCLGLCILLPFVSDTTGRCLVGVFLLITFTVMMYSMIDMYRIRYIITGEQILYRHGIFSYNTDYIELYRIYDYRQTRSALQQCIGLKNIVVMSSDKTTPILNIIGMKNELDIVSAIRERVEYNKQIKNVYEIANR